MASVKTYNSRLVTVALGTHSVTGFADDSFITVEPLGDGVTSKSGCDTSVLDTDLATIAPEITKAFESLSGDAVEKLLRDLLVRGNNIAVDFNSETKPLTEDLVNELFCGDVQDMYILAFHVIKINYGGFFGKLGTQSGKVAELAQKLMK